MQALVVYDSKFGNTRQVAVAITETLGAGAHVRHVAEVETDDLRGLDLLVVGSPTQGGRPTKAIQALLKEVRRKGSGAPTSRPSIRAPRQPSRASSWRTLMGLSASRRRESTSRCGRRAARRSPRPRASWSTAARDL